MFRALGIRRCCIYGAALAVALAGIAYLVSTPKVHSVQGEISFSPPDAVAGSGPFTSYVETMIAYTVAIDHLYNDTYAATELSSPGASLFGNGVHEGASVGISTAGSQWMPVVDRPVIVANVNAPSGTQAMEDLTGVLRQVETLSVQLQDDAGVPVAQRIRTTWNEHEFTVEPVSSTPAGVFKGSTAVILVALLFARLVDSAVDTTRHLARRNARAAPVEVSS